MKKRGQITTFIILGIVVLAIVAFFLYLRGATTPIIEERVPAPADVAPVQIFVEQCLQRILTEGTYSLGYQGGHIYPAENYLPLANYNATYAYYEGVSKVYTIEDISVELYTYLANSINGCTRNFEDFKGYDITGAIQNVSIRFDDEKVVFLIFYPLEIRKGDAYAKLSDFTVNVPVRLKYIQNVSNEIVAKSMAVSPCLVDMDYLGALDVNVTVIAYDNQTIVYSIKDPKSKLVEDSYSYVFASKLGPLCNVNTKQVGIRIINSTDYADFAE